MTNESYLRQELQNLVDMFGLAKVHETLRSFPGYCENCGCPMEGGEQHSLQGLGMCVTSYGTYRGA